MTIKEKILSYLEATGKVKADFFKAIDTAPSNFKGRGKNSALSGDKIAEILRLYPDLSPDWLLNGVGDMLRSDTPGDVEKTPPTMEDKLLTIIADKDNTIRTQAEEIGRLREQLNQAKREIELLETGKNVTTRHHAPQPVDTVP